MPQLYHTLSLFDSCPPESKPRRNRPPLIRTLVCPICGITKEYDANKRTGSVTCSRECGRLLRIKNYDPLPAPASKVCRKCGQEKSFTSEFFPPNKKHKSHKLYAYCRACNVEKRNAWAVAHPERLRESRRLYAFNKGARRRKVAGYVSVKIARVVLAEHEGRCAYCRREVSDYHFDHIQAVNRGGAHEYENICIACPECNYSKNQSTFEEWSVRRPIIDFTWVNDLLSRRSLAKSTNKSLLT